MTTATPHPLASLAAKLTDPQDRETYAGLISYFESLPPKDELFRLMELLGLLSLLGQRVPDALAEFLAKLREQTKVAAEYHAQVDSRLTRLPFEIAAGVNVDAIAKSMSESFRQQLTATGLQETAVLLQSSAKDIVALPGLISATLKPVSHEYRGISTSISTELTRLTAISRQLQDQNAKLIADERSNTWFWQSLLGFMIFLVGGLCGIFMEKRQTTNAIFTISTQLERMQVSSTLNVRPGMGVNHH